MNIKLTKQQIQTKYFLKKISKNWQNYELPRLDTNNLLQ
jgi:hypothetical protein